MNFKEIIRKIHPDVNKNIVNAGEKMRQCIYYRKDTAKLNELAIKWGLVPDPNLKPKPKVTKPRQTGSVWDTKKPFVRGTTGTKPRPIDNRIKANTVYCNGTEGYHKRFNRWYLINKTTAKMVYYWDAINQKTRKCSLKSMSIHRRQKK